MRLSTKLIVLAALGIAVIATSACLVLNWMFGVETLTVIEKKSPDRKHTATLTTREGGLDVNLMLEIDGMLVYASPDFAAPAKADFQERLVWDRTGQIALLEVAGERLFAFDASRSRALSAHELFQVQLASFGDLTFTDNLPRETVTTGRR